MGVSKVTASRARQAQPTSQGKRPGGYYDDKVIADFCQRLFPTDGSQIIVADRHADEPSENSVESPRRHCWLDRPCRSLPEMIRRGRHRCFGTADHRIEVS